MGLYLCTAAIATVVCLELDTLTEPIPFQAGFRFRVAFFLVWLHPRLENPVSFAA